MTRADFLARLERYGEGIGRMPVDAVPESGECRDGSVVGWVVVREVSEPEPDRECYGMPTRFVTCAGHDGAAGGRLALYAFNRAYPWLRGMPRDEGLGL